MNSYNYWTLLGCDVLVLRCYFIFALLYSVSFKFGPTPPHNKSKETPLKRFRYDLLEILI